MNKNAVTKIILICCLVTSVFSDNIWAGSESPTKKSTNYRKNCLMLLGDSFLYKIAGPKNTRRAEMIASIPYLGKEAVIGAMFAMAPGAVAGALTGHLLPYELGSIAVGAIAAPFVKRTILQARSKEHYWDPNFLRAATPTNKDFVPNLKLDSDFLKAKQMATRGVIKSKFDTQFDTTLYYSATGRPDAEGKIPMVDPEAKALVIFFPGAGTEGASGENFNYKANALAKMGYATLSFEYPWHKTGPSGKRFMDDFVFLNWVNEIIQNSRLPNQPVYLVGHSFGANTIAEYLHRFSNAHITGATLFSPIGIDRLSAAWVTQGKAANELESTGVVIKKDRAGGHWAYKLVQKYRLWNLRRNDMPLSKNSTPIRVVIGGKDQFLPHPGMAVSREEYYFNTQLPKSTSGIYAFGQFFENTDVVVEPDVGHAIFQIKDSKGKDLVIREILKTVGEDISNEIMLKTQFGNRTVSEPEALIQAYEREPLFRAWINGTYGREKLITNLNQKDINSSRAIIADYKIFENSRENQLIENIKGTANWAPKFYEDNKDAIESLGSPKGRSQQGALIEKYRKYLDENEKAAKPHSKAS